MGQGEREEGGGRGGRGGEERRASKGVGLGRGKDAGRGPTSRHFRFYRRISGHGAISLLLQDPAAGLRLTAALVFVISRVYIDDQAVSSLISISPFFTLNSSSGIFMAILLGDFARYAFARSSYTARILRKRWVIP